MNEFPYGNDLAKVREWIGQRDSLSNRWHIQYIGGCNTLAECEFHFLLHGMDNLVITYSILKSSSVLGLPIGLRGTISLPRDARDVSELMSAESRDSMKLAAEGAITESQTMRAVNDVYADSKIWEQ